MSTDWSEELFEKAANLGELRHEFAPPRHRLLINVIVAIPILLVSLVAVVFLALVGGGPRLLIMPFWFNMMAAVQNHILLFLAVTALLAAVVVPLRIYRSRNLRVLVFDKGLVSLSGANVDIVAWDEIVVVRQRVNVSWRRALFWGARLLMVQCRDSRRLQFSEPRLFSAAKLPLTPLLQRLIEKGT
jgi:uncharacterized protein DUF6585